MCRLKVLSLKNVKMLQKMYIYHLRNVLKKRKQSDYQVQSLDTFRESLKRGINLITFQILSMGNESILRIDNV